MKHKSSPKQSKRKYNRMAAAVAGAAVLSSTMLPGLPAARVQASPDAGSDNADITSPTDNTATAAKAPADTASQNDTRERDTDRNRTRDDRHHDQDQAWDNPVRVVMRNAARFGFNPSTDNFSLLSSSNGRATVEVRTSTQTFKVDLIKRNDDWVITTIRGIGNSRYPATYIPASMFSSNIGTAQPSINISDATTIYQTDQYADWSWQEAAYPKDMSFGVLIQQPWQTDTDIIPADVLTAIKDVDFTNDFVIYAHLGSVAANGYGIGIEKVAQSGNDFIVTVRAKSPTANQAAADASKVGDFVKISRSALDFSNPVSILFVTADGTTLRQYTLSRR